MSIQLNDGDDEKQSGTLKPDLLAEYYTEPELAHVLKKSPRTIQRMRQMRKLPFTFIGKTPIYPINGVRAALHASEVGPIRRRRG
jgi:hypothetical protein